MATGGDGKLIMELQEHDGQLRGSMLASLSALDLRSQYLPEKTGMSKKAQYR